jgi:alkylated DNA repair dioxygenase AlkB
MLSLFDQEDYGDYAGGFRFCREFINEQEEKYLLNCIGSLDLHPFRFQGFEAKRKVASFGFDYHFDGRGIQRGNAIPDYFLPLIRKVSAFAQVSAEEMKELLVTEYPAGAVINWYRDAPPFGLVAGVSLMSECRFRLRPYNKKLRSKKLVRNLILPPRSLYIMSGEVREDWEHSIAAVGNKRISITLRTLREKSEGLLS